MANQERERYAWYRAYKVSDKLDDQMKKDQRYLSEMFDTLSTLKDNKLAFSVAEEFIWSFVQIKQLTHQDDKCLDYMTKVSFNPETEKYDHVDPNGIILYSTKRGNGRHAVLRNIPITRRNYRIEQKEFILNEKKWKWVDANGVLTKGHEDGWYEKA
jgi:hypothetical protein